MTRRDRTHDRNALQQDAIGIESKHTRNRAFHSADWALHEQGIA
jgi:hypothetical protein